MDTRGVRSKPKAGPQGAASSAPGSRTVFSLSEEETLDLGRGVGRSLKGGELLLLEGDLGYGKTVFARGVATALGIPPEEVTSPSYTLVHEYKGGRVPVFHLDLYRLDENDEQAGGFGVEEILAAGGVVLVEWGEKLPPFLKRGATTIRFHDVGEGSRRIEIVAEPKTVPRPRGDA
ncbi:MAG TPA: tRNA (adenosine(37)-N6)-threonylcarbamoyltransferase complex ATPase subunit type 1 TsaE [Candidatus Polarisedimenticolaceae bacterium]|nr:tRNA (adenosine(37)-N6)-threonylcarbamoyltransferase complex ATPase subunit type 1 TsaE [Candidatus Polarisedimenticolaceae bacterium]